MVNDPYDHNQIIIDLVEDTVPLVNQAANALAQFGTGRPGKGVLSKQIEGCIETEKILVRHLPAELVDAVLAYRNQIRASGAGGKYSSHGAQVVRR